MRLKVNEVQRELLLELISDSLDINNAKYTELKEVKDALQYSNTKDGIISEFIEIYKYDNDDIKFKDNEYDIGLLLNGVDYHAHWTNKDKENNKIRLNNFIVNYRAIIDAIGEVDDDGDVFKTEDEYKQIYNKFEKDLKEIGVTFYEECDEGYDVLMVYSLPIDKILNEDFIEQFTKILKNYGDSFNEELKLLY